MHNFSQYWDICFICWLFF